MALGVYFAVKGMTADKHNEVIARLEAAGAGAPASRLYHCAFEAGTELHVFDVYDSQEHFEGFGQTLMPILGELGIDPGEPIVSPVHNIIAGG